MSSSTEVLHTASAKYQRGPKVTAVGGIVKISSQRISWESNEFDDTSTASIDIQNITANQRSKAGAPTAMVRFVTPKNTMILQFATEKERDTLSDLVVQLLAKIKSKGKAPEGAANSGTASTPSGDAPRRGPPPVSPVDLAARKALLASNKDLNSLHTELVGGGAVTELDFWAARQGLLEAGRAKAGAGQQVGISNALMAEVRPTSDGRSHAVKFSLTAEMMHQIFAERPAVRRAYVSCVPEKMSEKEFWTRYCRSQYFQKVRKGAAAQGEEEAEDAALFAEKSAASSIPTKRLKSIHPQVDLVSAACDSLAPGWGVRRDGGKEAPSLREEEQAAEAEEGRVPQSKQVIHSINRHAAVVLAGRPAWLAPDAPTSQVLAAASHEESIPSSEDQDNQCETMPDLAGPREEKLEELCIADAKRYFQATNANTTTITKQEADTLNDSSDPPLCSADRLERFQLSWLKARDPVILSPLAHQVLLDLSHQSGGASEGLLDACHVSGENSQLSPASQTEMLQLARTSQELLRHFWAQQPANTNIRIAKVERIKTAMSAIYDKLQALKKALPSSQVNAASHLLRPVFTTLDTAFDVN